jgi:hypothetical protein
VLLDELVVVVDGVPELDEHAPTLKAETTANPATKRVT